MSSSHNAAELRSQRNSYANLLMIFITGLGGIVFLKWLSNQNRSSNHPLESHSDVVEKSSQTVAAVATSISYAVFNDLLEHFKKTFSEWISKPSEAINREMTLSRFGRSSGARRLQEYPSVLYNRLTISRGQTVILNTSMIDGTVPNFLGDIRFSVRDGTVYHTNIYRSPGIPVYSFSTSDLENGIISVTHDGSLSPPSYSIYICTNATYCSSDMPLTVNFNDLYVPFLIANTPQLVTYQQGTSPVVIDPTINVSMINPPNYLGVSAYVTISGNLQPTDLLTCVGNTICSPSFFDAYNPNTGVLLIRASTPTSLNFMFISDALRAVAYQDTSFSSAPLSRTIHINITDGRTYRQLSYGAQIIHIDSPTPVPTSAPSRAPSFAPSNTPYPSPTASPTTQTPTTNPDAPRVTDAGDPRGITSLDGGAGIIAPYLRVFAGLTPSLVSAQACLAGGAQGDTIAFPSSLLQTFLRNGNALATLGLYDAASGCFKFTLAPGTASQYQDMLSNLTIQGGNVRPRNVTFVVGDLGYDSNVHVQTVQTGGGSSAGSSVSIAAVAGGAAGAAVTVLFAAVACRRKGRSKHTSRHDARLEIHDALQKRLQLTFANDSQHTLFVELVSQLLGAALNIPEQASDTEHASYHESVLQRLSTLSGPEKRRCLKALETAFRDQLHFRAYCDRSSEIGKINVDRVGLFSCPPCAYEFNPQIAAPSEMQELKNTVRQTMGAAPLTSSSVALEMMPTAPSAPPASLSGEPLIPTREGEGEPGEGVRATA